LVFFGETINNRINKELRTKLFIDIVFDGFIFESNSLPLFYRHIARAWDYLKQWLVFTVRSGELCTSENPKAKGGSTENFVGKNAVLLQGCNSSLSQKLPYHVSQP